MRQHLTQKERDTETGLDFFGARYFASSQGRFTSIDPARIKLKQLLDPQDLNRYSYVANNPLAFVDLDGQEKVKIIIRTFIPEKTVSIPAGITVKDPGLPLPANRTFAGDNRKVGEAPERFRTQQIITIETDPRKNGGCATCAFQSSEAKAGKTRELFEGGKEVSGEANVDRIKASAVYPDTRSQDTLVVSATGRASDPLVAGAPDLKYDLDIGLSYGKDGSLYAFVHGSKSEFPGIEVFVQRPEANDKSEQLVTGYNPQDQGRGLLHIYLTDEIDAGKKLKN